MCCLRYEYEGDMDTISSDDEILIEEEDAPIEVIEEKISTILSKSEADENGIAVEDTEDYSDDDEETENNSSSEPPKIDEKNPQVNNEKRHRRRFRRRRHRRR
jgi:hypothetical protein